MFAAVNRKKPMGDNPIPRRPATGAQPRADRSRDQLIDETVACILEEGFSGASAQHIAERAGVTWGVVQYHFGGRRGLLTAVVDAASERLLDALDALPIQIDGLDGVARVEYIVSTLWEIYTEPKTLAALEILIATRQIRDDDAARRLADRTAALYQLSQGIGRDLSSREAWDIGILIQVVLHGLAAAQLVMPHPVDTTAERQTLVHVIGEYLNGAAGSGDSAG